MKKIKLITNIFLVLCIFSSCLQEKTNEDPKQSGVSLTNEAFVKHAFDVYDGLAKYYEKNTLKMNIFIDELNNKVAEYRLVGNSDHARSNTYNNKIIKTQHDDTSKRSIIEIPEKRQYYQRGPEKKCTGMECIKIAKDCLDNGGVVTIRNCVYCISCSNN